MLKQRLIVVRSKRNIFDLIRNFTGRKPQFEILKQVLTSPDPEFIAVYGRRCIGKTFLIWRFFEKYLFNNDNNLWYQRKQPFNQFGNH
jgi:hypothetical protein